MRIVFNFSGCLISKKINGTVCGNLWKSGADYVNHLVTRSKTFFARNILSRPYTYVTWRSGISHNHNMIIIVIEDGVEEDRRKKSENDVSLDLRILFFFPEMSAIDTSQRNDYTKYVIINHTIIIRASFRYPVGGVLTFKT